ncbi:MAG: GGDEF domain-containing protein [Pseudomonadota bacterium]
MTAAALVPGRAESLCLSTLRELAHRRIEPTPRHYRLFYLYVSGGNPRLNAVLDRLAAPDGHLDDGKLIALYDAFVVGPLSFDALKGIMEAATGCVRSVGTRIGSVGESAARLSSEVRQILEKRSTTPEAGVRRVHEAAAATRAAVGNLEGLALDRAKQVAELRRALAAAQQACSTDPLTGQGNRAGFDGELARLEAEARAGGRGFALVMADIDHFKSVNDTYGHEMGDRVLRLVAARLAEGGQRVYRVGGEEFALLLVGATSDEAAAVAEGLRRRLARSRIVRRSDPANLHHITISFGVAGWRPSDTPGSLFCRADKALYAAKHAGRNVVRQSA